MIFASWNLGKLKEITQLFKSAGLSVIGLSDLTQEIQSQLPDFSVIETGDTFAANAEIKARAVWELTHDWVMADDSGLEVDALNGQPGVKSARWVVGTDQDRNLALLDKLRLIPDSNRGAQFVTTICLIDPTGTVNFFEGVVRGTIAHQIRAIQDQGFGYDPVFIPEGKSKTFSELGVNYKNTVSHRAKALEKLIAYLKKNG